MKKVNKHNEEEPKYEVLESSEKYGWTPPDAEKTETDLQDFKEIDLLKKRIEKLESAQKENKKTIDELKKRIKEIDGVIVFFEKPFGGEYE